MSNLQQWITDAEDDEEARVLANNALHDMRPAPKVIQAPDYCRDAEAAFELAEALLPVPPGWVEGAPSSTGWKIGVYRGMLATGERGCVWEAMIRPHGIQWGYDHSAKWAALAIVRSLMRAISQTPIHKQDGAT